jgi:HlyD family secretion protein
VQNVVTYDVVIDVQNPELMLKPGMTANVNLVTAHHDGVLRVPVQALHFSPANARATGSHQPAVWLDEGGDLRKVAVTTGINDGEYVEITGGDLRQGEVVAVGETGASPSARVSSGNLLQSAHVMH